MIRRLIFGSVKCQGQNYSARSSRPIPKNPSTIRSRILETLETVDYGSQCGRDSPDIWFHIWKIEHPGAATLTDLIQRLVYMSWYQQLARRPAWFR